MEKELEFNGIPLVELRIGSIVYAGIDEDEEGNDTYMMGKILMLGAEGGLYWTNDLKQKTLYEGYNGGSCDFLHPIPLTVELMNKLQGWERLPQDNGPIVYRKKLSPVGKYLVVSVGGEIVTVLEEYMEAMGQPVGKRHMILLPFHAKALHQLQNLYFALTGTELEINL